MTSSLIRGKYVIAKITGPSSADVVTDGAVLQQDGQITEVGDYQELRTRHPELGVIGSSNHLVMPGRVNDLSKEPHGNESFFQQRRYQDCRGAF
jgi:cytosine/adenosine deaminase-related metal-dependent hydrolase